jgi:hypothetical protein
VRKSAKDKVYSDREKIKGAAAYFEQNSDIIRDNESDNKSDVTTDKTSDSVNDNESAVTSNINSDIISDIDSAMLKPRKQPKYTDLHDRRTHYLTKDNIDFIDTLYSKYNQDKSETVNRALLLYREWIKKNRKNGK